MMNKNKRFALLATAAVLPGVSHAQIVISDTLTGTSSSYNWQALNGACLTAGNNTGTIPACSGLSYYSGKTQVGGTTGRLPDQPGSGALRLTNGDTGAGTNGNSQTGAVVSNFTFPTNQGLQVTFTTVTYGGNAYKNANGVKSGADGISFFLADGSKPATVGALGGSLGYSCSNGNATYDGVQGGYIGLGIDEFGNFSNSNDNTSTGANPNGGAGAIPGRISLRGAGNTNWANLSSNYPKYYPSSLSSSQQSSAVQSTCAAGYLYNFSGKTQYDANGYKVSNGNQTSEPVNYNYNYLSGDTLNGVTIFSQEATNNPVRGSATPITYALTVTQDGLLSLSYSVNGGIAQPVITNQSITASNGPLPSSFRFGFSAGTGGGSNVHEITCFKAAPVGQSSSSAGTNIPQLGRVTGGTQLYLAYYHQTNWWGELTAQTLGPDASGKLVINSTANWDASCTLTGGACPAMGSSATVAVQAPTARNILTWNGTSGVPFQWANLTSAQKTALTAGDSSATSARLLYLRGTRTYEVSNGGSFRTRTGVLGDIINSSPSWVGGPSAPYNGPWVDALYAKATPLEPTGSYANFKTTYGQRLNVVYVGANDGMLHGFRAGSYDVKGNFVNNATTPNDGQEALAYMPTAVVNTIHSSSNGKLDFASPSYAHNLYMDATPGTGELYYNGAWHTWLVGGMGGGGNTNGPIGDGTTQGTGAIYALDITDPSTFSESNASNLVIGEWGPGSITCANVTNCGAYLGNTYGTPIIRRLHNGSWAALFGNGLNSQNGTAGMYIMLVDPAKGTTSFRYIDTGYGPSQDPAGGNNKNGIAYVTSADLDGDHITDYVYAGDVFGNLWRFDLTAQNPASWSVSSAPLFSTSVGQPITTKVVVASIPGSGSGSKPRVLVSFGTGQTQPATLTSAATNATAAQALYGIWDWNMNAWNAIAPETAKYTSLTAPQTVTGSSLQQQTITVDAAATATATGTAQRVISSNKVCWQGSSDCAGTNNNQYGWTLPLPAGQNEQAVFSPTLQYGVFNINTLIPAVQQVLSCNSTPATGYSYGLSVATGGATPNPYFYDANGNYLTQSGAAVSAVGMSGTGTSTFVTVGSNVYAVMQGADGTPRFIRINPNATGVGSRLNWVKLR
ncbi:pilus assembly protein PilY [Ralstonia sp. A12]|uniref:pilus assembly protein n=1 Tax=Ralstonia sp. A12 TaxID=1217052 RepID=UPI0005736D85|nr:PilC/PilY family type IV pilus protein [Ralstonia sp. A12]KHK56147.1 pilus assembly protein PilY [Ralstonia sp. A12]